MMAKVTRAILMHFLKGKKIEVREKDFSGKLQSIASGEINLKSEQRILVAVF